MFRKTGMAAGLAGVATMLLVAGTTFGAAPASAAAAAACTVVGEVTVTNGPPDPNTPAASNPDSFEFTGVTIQCVGTSPIGGTYTGVEASGGSSSNTGGGETCAEAKGGGSFRAGTNGTDSITGGAFTFVRAGLAVQVTGDIDTTAGTFPFAASLSFVPTSGGCDPLDAHPNTTTTADMTGTAEIYQV
jgi:hypothetical protein